MNERLLLVANASETEALKDALVTASYEVDCVDSGGEAIRSVDRTPPDVAIIDLHLAGEVDGIEAAATIGRIGIPVVCLADEEDEALLKRAADVGTTPFLALTADEEQIRLVVRAALSETALHTRRINPPSVSQSIASLRQRYGSRLTENLFDSISDGVVVTDFQGQLLYANPGALRIFGDVDEMVKDWFMEYEFLQADQRTPLPFSELPAVAAARGQSRDNVEIFVRRRGATDGIFINVHGRPLLDANGVPVGAVTVMRDISNSKTVEADLQDTVAKYQEQNTLMTTIFESISDGLIVADRNGDYLIFNRSAERILGKHAPDSKLHERSKVYGTYRPDETTPYPVDELPLTKALCNESTNNVEVFIRNEQRPEGAYVSMSGRPLRDENGELTGGTIVFRDVTETRRAQRELERTYQRLYEHRQTTDAVFESMRDGVLVFDTGGDLVFANESAKRMVGRGMLDKSDPVRWQEGHGIFFPDETTRLPVEQFPHTRVLQGEIIEDMNIFIRNPRIPNGVHLGIDCRPMYDRHGTFSGAVLVAHDETASRRANQALTNAFAHGRLEILDTIVHNIGNAINSVSVGVNSVREQVQENHLLRRFSALAAAVEAHRSDWQTYLATDAQGKRVLPFMLALAKDFERQNEKLSRTIERVDARVRHIVEIVRTQTASHNGAMLRTDIDLEQSITAACNILRDSMVNRGIELGIDCQNAPTEIRVQESNFHQLIVNLVKNAVDAIDDLRRAQESATPGRIQIDCHVDGDTFVIKVTDNGIGIAPEQFKEIFLPGYTTKVDGTGLGLHSAANYVISSGGTIEPSSPGVGHGATMRVAWRTAAVLAGSEHRE